MMPEESIVPCSSEISNKFPSSWPPRKRGFLYQCLIAPTDVLIKLSKLYSVTAVNCYLIFEINPLRGLPIKTLALVNTT